MTRKVYDDVEDAIYCVAHHTDGRTLTQTAAEMGWKVDVLSRATNQHEKPRFAASWIVPLTLTTGNYAVIRTICKLVGGVFFQPPRPSSHDRLVASTLIEFSEYLAILAKSMDDGRCTKAEYSELENHMHDVMASMLTHLEKLKAEAK